MNCLFYLNSVIEYEKVNTVIFRPEEISVKYFKDLACSSFLKGRVYKKLGEPAT